jgi:mRNA interferase RelE/StbE
MRCVTATKSAADDLIDLTRNTTIYKRVRTVISGLASSDNIFLDFDIKKLKGSDDAYRIRVGDYRICFCIESDSAIVLYGVFHRSKAYRNFP